MNNFKRIAIASLAALSVTTGIISPAVAAPALSSGSSNFTAPDINFPPINSGDVAQREHNVEQETLRLLNQHRVANGLQPVRIDQTLMAQSKEWSGIMANTGDFKHGDYNVFENIAYNYSDNPAELFNQWKGSPGHNRNMLNKDVTRAGVGVIIKDGRTYGTMQLMW